MCVCVRERESVRVCECVCERECVKEIELSVENFFESLNVWKN